MQIKLCLEIYAYLPTLLFKVSKCKCFKCAMFVRKSALNNNFATKGIIVTFICDPILHVK